MFRLTRELRLSLSHDPAGPFPQLIARVTLESPLDPRSQYVLDIKHIDRAFDAAALPLLRAAYADRTLTYTPALLRTLHAALVPHFPTAHVAAFTLLPTPHHHLTLTPMPPSQPSNGTTQPSCSLHLRFEFSAAHRLHNPALSDVDNAALFGKCNNPLGHGHNYELEVSLAEPHPPLPEIQSTVRTHVLLPFDHKHLNEEVPEFQRPHGDIPTVENIAKAIHLRLRHHLPTLQATTVWETPKTWAEYRG